jgi:hypothetical protein
VGGIVDVFGQRIPLIGEWKVSEKVIFLWILPFGCRKLQRAGGQIIAPVATC